MPTFLSPSAFCRADAFYELHGQGEDRGRGRGEGVHTKSKIRRPPASFKFLAGAFLAVSSGSTYERTAACLIFLSQ